jgi:diacylglycerol kinase family enzyme
VFHHVVADGADLSGEYIAAEALNIRQIGPRILLAPNARTDDGLLDLVLVPPGDRAALAEHVAVDAKGAPPGITRRVRQVEISWPRHGGHLDDEPWRIDAGGTHADTRVRLEIGGAIDVLLPPQAIHATRRSR